MTSSYDDLSAATEMQADCRATSARLAQAARRVTLPAPSIYFDEQPGERAKPQVEFSAAAARIAGALHFHLE